MFKGLHYRSSIVYDGLTWLKLRSEFDLRFEIAAGYVREGDCVLDVCAGNGRLKRFLPESCHYAAVDASPQFTRRLRSERAEYFQLDLHYQAKDLRRAADISFMLISLCQFRDSSADELLSHLKTLSPRVFVIEDTVPSRGPYRKAVQPVMNYLCAESFFKPMQLFTHEEFQTLMERHGYKCARYNKRYAIGYYENES